MFYSLGFNEPYLTNGINLPVGTGDVLISLITNPLYFNDTFVFN